MRAIGNWRRLEENDLRNRPGGHSPSPSLSRRERSKSRRYAIFAAIVCLLAMSASAFAASTSAATTAPATTAATTSHSPAAHTDPFSLVLLELAVVIILAMAGRWAAIGVKQPAVLGELLIGVALGNIGYALGQPLFVLIMHFGDVMPVFAHALASGQSIASAATHVFSPDQLAAGGTGRQLVDILTGPTSAHFALMGFALWLFSTLGVILLLFMVGLESSVDEMLLVGPRATLVAVVGVVLPLAGGFLAGLWLLPDAGTPTHLFLAATLCATSVGITARVFKDLGTIQTREAKLVLGAAVIDDVLGLIILAIAVGVASTGGFDGWVIGRITLLSGVFLFLILFFGERLAGLLARVGKRLDPSHNNLLLPLALCFALAWAAGKIQLATIVGAFAAGLILKASHFDDIQHKSQLEKIVSPVEKIFAPIFFVLMGMQVNLATFADTQTLGLAAALTAIAIVTKLLCGLPAGRGLHKLTIGLAMIPRGEVGLIFASVGKGLGVLTDADFSAIVIMVIVTTLVTPPALAKVQRAKFKVQTAE
jgi:Kef-type K+ transport system membrane component KefB